MRLTLGSGYETGEIDFLSQSQPAHQDNHGVYEVEIGPPSLTLLVTLIEKSEDLEADLACYVDYCSFLSRFSPESQIAILQWIYHYIKERRQLREQIEMTEGRMEIARPRNETRGLVFKAIFPSKD